MTLEPTDSTLRRMVELITHAVTRLDAPRALCDTINSVEFNALNRILQANHTNRTTHVSRVNLCNRANVFHIDRGFVRFTLRIDAGYFPIRIDDPKSDIRILDDGFNLMVDVAIKVLHQVAQDEIALQIIQGSRLVHWDELSLGP